MLIGFSLDIPPAKISPNCGAPVGIGGADKLPGGGAPPLPLVPEDPTDPPPTTGELLSLVSACFNLAPFLISANIASRPCMAEGAGLGADPPLIGGGGGGGGGAGGPGIFSTDLILDLGWSNPAIYV